MTRIIVGLLLATVVSVTNGIAGVGYTIGGEFDAGFSSLGSEKSDPRWELVDGVKRPKSTGALLSLLWASDYGRFGLSLQVVSLLQFVAGLVLMFRNNIGSALSLFVLLVAAAGIVVEIVGGRLSSSFGITNIICTLVSLGAIGICFSMHQHSDEDTDARGAA